jgi:glycerol-3-phosphate dehydrogenase
MGLHFGAGLYQVEVDFLCQTEWAESAEDITFRRTKLGMKMTAAEIGILHKHLNNRVIG